VEKHGYCSASQWFKNSEYCAKCNIHLQTFYTRRSEINKKAVQTTSKLVKVLKSKSQLVSTILPLTIIHSEVTLSVAQPVEATWLADVMKALAL
jgi:hypothetical protein